MIQQVGRGRWLWVLLVSSLLASAQEVAVTARVALMDGGKKNQPRQAGNVVLWLAPQGGAVPAAWPADPPQRPRLVQKHKSFTPHILVVPVGAVVEFPNEDQFFHNVFSLFDGKRFDLGLYEAGTTRDVHFDKPGISYIFCNIHAEMSAVVIALNTPYYGISDAQGQVVIPHVPAGRYALHIWYEAALPEVLNRMTREIVVSENNSTLGLLRLPSVSAPTAHKNKYGQDYPPPAPDSSTYQHP
jgi:plastocyanin